RTLAREMPDSAEFIVLHRTDWHSGEENPLGVVGLVAGKLVDEFGRPALVLAPGLMDGESRGSARSPSDFDIYEALTEVRELLVRFGGHSAAAGLTVKNEDIEELNRRLCELASSRHSDNGRAQPTYTADAEIAMS